MSQLLPLLFLLATSASAPSQTVIDPRLQVIDYDAGRVVNLKVAVDYQATIILARGEIVENVAVGNSEAWQVTANQRGDALFVKPLRPDSVSNMTVITSARVYIFELMSTAGPDSDAAMTLRFTYPGAQPSQGPAIAEPITGRYRIGGARRLRPVAMSDDGTNTVIEWQADQPVPAIFAIDERGDEVLLQGHVREGRYVLDAVHPTLVFRMNGQTARAIRLRPEQ